jgi:hypothetical protein
LQSVQAKRKRQPRSSSTLFVVPYEPTVSAPQPDFLREASPAPAAGLAPEPVSAGGHRGRVPLVLAYVALPPGSLTFLGRRGLSRSRTDRLQAPRWRYGRMPRSHPGRLERIPYCGSGEHEEEDHNDPRTDGVQTARGPAASSARPPAARVGVGPDAGSQNDCRVALLTKRIAESPGWTTGSRPPAGPGATAAGPVSGRWAPCPSRRRRRRRRGRRWGRWGCRSCGSPGSRCRCARV